MTTLEYCAEAEPRLLKLAERVESGDVDGVRDELERLVGPKRFAAEFAKAQRPCPEGRDQTLFALECWWRAHPDGDPIHRLTGSFCPGGDRCKCLVCTIAAEMGLQ